MSGERYPQEFKIERVKQITERGHTVTEGGSGWQSPRGGRLVHAYPDR